jgi:hypothetical protein
MLSNLVLFAENLTHNWSWSVWGYCKNGFKFEGVKLNFLSYIAAADYLGKAPEM